MVPITGMNSICIYGGQNNIEPSDQQYLDDIHLFLIDEKTWQQCKVLPFGRPGNRYLHSSACSNSSLMIIGGLTRGSFASAELITIQFEAIENIQTEVVLRENEDELSDSRSRQSPKRVKSRSDSIIKARDNIHSFVPVPGLMMNVNLPDLTKPKNENTFTRSKYKSIASKLFI